MSRSEIRTLSFMWLTFENPCLSKENEVY